MTIVFASKLNEFSRRYVNAQKSLFVWQLVTEKATWKMKQDVLADFPKAKMLKNSRARFEIVHNAYRLIAKIDYECQVVEIRFIGTHSEYDRIDPTII